MPEAALDTELRQTTSIPKYMYLTVSAIGVLIGSLFAIFYSGSFIIPDSLIQVITKKDEIISPPGIGFDYSSRIRSIPEKVFSQPNQVRSLAVEGGVIRSLSENISLFSSIEKLQIKDNKLRSLPDNLGNLYTLESLDFGGNKLSKMPENIGGLSNLKYLFLYNNSLSNLPESIGNLSSLEVLDLRNNKLTSLPNSIGQLANLKFLFLGGNNFSESEKNNITNLLPNTQIFF